jgi:hypothetical protein
MRFKLIFSLFLSTTATVTFIAKVLQQATTIIPDPHQPNIIATCTSFYKISLGDICNTMLAHLNHDITLSQFCAWNPDIG